MQDIFFSSSVDIFDQAGRTILTRVGNTARKMVMQGSLPQAAIKWSPMDLGAAVTYHKLAGIRWAEAEFLDVIGTKVLRVFSTPPSPLPKMVWNWFVMETLYLETSNMRTFKIMPRNFNQFLCIFFGGLECHDGHVVYFVFLKDISTILCVIEFGFGTNTFLKTSLF